MVTPYSPVTSLYYPQVTSLAQRFGKLVADRFAGCCGIVRQSGRLIGAPAARTGLAAGLSHLRRQVNGVQRASNLELVRPGLRARGHQLSNRLRDFDNAAAAAETGL